jgi:outer membrane protein assembly factor BamD
MHRLSKRIAAVAVAFVVLTAVSAHADKKPKKKKNVDLSANPLADVNSKQPDKELFDKAMLALKKGHFDVARLDLQTMLNTYPESEYRMRAKLAVGDSWFKEGGTAALTQAEAEYKDFITFFPNAPEAAEAQMKVADIYYEQMEKPDRDPVNAERAELEYRNMINMFPDSTLVPRAKQKLRDVQEVLAERETDIGLFYESRENFGAAIARLETVTDTYPLYSKSDQALLGIGDAYAGEARRVQVTPNLPGAIKERLHSAYLDKAAAAYSKVITRYPMAPHVEDARDRLVAMNHPVPEPTQEAVAENDAEERSRQALHFTDKTLGVIKHGPSVV